MRRELTVLRAGAPPEACTVAAPTTAGGSRADGLLLPGAPPAAALLVPCAAGVVVEARAAGVRVAGHALPPGGRRLLRPGERAELQGSSLSVEDAAGGPAEDCDAPGGATRVAAAALLRDAAAGAGAGPRLVVLTGPAAGDRHALGEEQTVGRGGAATLRISDPRASRVHARIRAGTGGASIEDLRSKNGVRVNGVRMDGRVAPLRPGDEVAIGDTVLALEDPCPAAPREPRPAPPARASRPARPAPRGARAAAAALLAACAAALALAGS